MYSYREARFDFVLKSMEDEGRLRGKTDLQGLVKDIELINRVITKLMAVKVQLSPSFLIQEAQNEEKCGKKWTGVQQNSHPPLINTHSLELTSRNNRPSSSAFDFC